MGRTEYASKPLGHAFEECACSQAAISSSSASPPAILTAKWTTSSSVGVIPEQVQIFTPTHWTYATLMYYTETDPFTGDPIFMEKSFKGKRRQKRILTQ